MYRFEIITDSRDGGEVLERLQAMTEAIERDVSTLGGVQLINLGTRLCNFGSDYQYRTAYMVKKQGRAVTWDEVFRTINATKAPVYKHVA